MIEGRIINRPYYNDISEEVSGRIIIHLYRRERKQTTLHNVNYVSLDKVIN